MPVYRYEVIESGEIFEVEQSINAEPISLHPETGEKVRRVYSKLNINAQYTKSKEDKLSDVSHIKKSGFKILQKDKLTGNYYEM